MRYLLNTDVLSQTTKAKPHTGVLAWLRERPDSELWLSAVTIEERVANKCGKLFAAAKLTGDNLDMGDVFIAATASVHDLKIATLNRKHFDGLGVELVKF